MTKKPLTEQKTKTKTAKEGRRDKKKGTNRPRAARSAGKSVPVELHGLGNFLKAIHNAPADVKETFAKEMGRSLTVSLDADTASLDAGKATKMKNFAKEHLPDHHVTASFHGEDCDCDPVNDPYCICF